MKRGDAYRIVMTFGGCADLDAGISRYAMLKNAPVASFGNEHGKANGGTNRGEGDVRYSISKRQAVSYAPR